MSTTLFRPATRKKVRGRIGLDGPAGSGKTFTALRLAFTLAGEKKIAVINSESGAVEKYLGLAPDGIAWQFDVCELADFAPSAYTSAILEAGRLGYGVIVIDSLSHAWNGVGGALEIVSKKGGNSYTAWKDVTPMHNAMIEAILRSPAHVIATIRSKMDYVLEEYEDSQGRKKSMPRKVGMAPVQRNGMEYEFDVFCDLDSTHTLTVSKTRCPELDGLTAVKPGAAEFAPLVRWLNEGSDVDPSYYIASQADLERSLAMRAAQAKEAALHAGGNGEVAAEKPLDAKELMRQRAAAARAKAGDVPAKAAPAAPPSPKEESPATEGQQGSAPLSASGDGTEAAPPPVETAVDQPSAKAPTAKPIGVSAETLKRIEEYGPRVYGDDWPEKRGKICKMHGVGRVASLNQEQLDGLLSHLMAKELGLKN